MELSSVVSSSIAPRTPPVESLDRSDEEPPERVGRLLCFDLDHKERFDRALHQVRSALSEYSFANSVAWRWGQELFLAEIEGCLGLFALRDGLLALALPPLGPRERQAEAVVASFEVMAGYNGRLDAGAISCVSGELLALLRDEVPRWPGGHTLVIEAGHPDFVYRRADLVELRGNDYKSKRSDINNFLRAHPDAHLAPLAAEDRPEIDALCRSWLDQRAAALGDAVLCERAWEEFHAIGYAIEHMEALGLVGARLLVGGRCEGFTLGERLQPGVAHVLFEKTNRELRGAAQFIFREFLRVFDECELVNTGDGLGCPSLTRAKLSYRPIYLAEKFSLRLG